MSSKRYFLYPIVPRGIEEYSFSVGNKQFALRVRVVPAHFALLPQVSVPDSGGRLRPSRAVALLKLNG